MLVMTPTYPTSVSFHYLILCYLLFFLLHFGEWFRLLIYFGGSFL